MNLLAKMNNRQTRRTLTLLIFTTGELQGISSQAKEHWWTEESLTIYMGPAASGLSQQGHIELHIKDWACVKAGGGYFERDLKKIA